MKMIRALSLCCALVLPAMAAKTEMTYEQYQQELSTAQNREKVAKEQIAVEQAQIESLKQQISDLEAKITAVKQEKYDILGITEADVIAAEQEIASIKQGLEALLALAPEDLKKRKKEIQPFEDRISALKKKPVSYLWRIRDQIIPLDDLLARVKANLNIQAAVGSGSQYTVQDNPGNRDCLYRIAEKPETYGDPTKWPMLYRNNKSIIDAGYNRYTKNVAEPKFTRAEDLIFPGQVLEILR